MYVVGLTGGIGSGKSTVADAFARLGVPVVDADAVSHTLTRRGAAGWDAVRKAFGDGFLDASGELDRARLRATVFADAPARQRLEAVLHPLIGVEVDRQVGAASGPYVILMVPLLLESGHYRRRVDRLLVVDCPEDEQVRRVVARSAMSAAQVRAIIASQATRAERLAAADDVVDNSGAPGAIIARVAELDRTYRRLAAGEGA